MLWLEKVTARTAPTVVDLPNFFYPAPPPVELPFRYRIAADHTKIAQSYNKRWTRRKNSKPGYFVLPNFIVLLPGNTEEKTVQKKEQNTAGFSPAPFVRMPSE